MKKPKGITKRQVRAAIRVIEAYHQEAEIEKRRTQHDERRWLDAFGHEARFAKMRLILIMSIGGQP